MPASQTQDVSAHIRIQEMCNLIMVSIELINVLQLHVKEINPWITLHPYKFQKQIKNLLLSHPTEESKQITYKYGDTQSSCKSAGHALQKEQITAIFF